MGTLFDLLGFGKLEPEDDTLQSAVALLKVTWRGAPEAQCSLAYVHWSSPVGRFRTRSQLSFGSCIAIALIYASLAVSANLWNNGKLKHGHTCGRTSPASAPVVKRRAPKMKVEQHPGLSMNPLGSSEQTDRASLALFSISWVTGEAPAQDGQLPILLP